MYSYKNPPSSSIGMLSANSAPIFYEEGFLVIVPITCNTNLLLYNVYCILMIIIYQEI